jgi:acetyl esterase/lipase
MGICLTLTGTASNQLFESELTVFFVGRRRTGGGFAPGGVIGNFQTGGDWGHQGWSMNVLSTGEYAFRLGNGNNVQITGGSMPLGTDFVLMAARYQNTGADAGRMELFGTLNEDPVGANSSPFNIQSSTVDIGIGMYCGWRSLTFSASVAIDVAEIRIYGEALSDTEQQTVYDALAAKYGLSARALYNVVNVSPSGFSAPADSSIELTFDVPMDPATIPNIDIGEGGLQGLPEQGGWQTVTGQWAASAGDTVFTFTPDAPFAPGSLVLIEIPDTVASAAGGVNASIHRELRSFVVDTGRTYPVEVSLIDPMAIVSQNNGDPHILPLELHIPDTGEPVPVMFWVHGGTFGGNNSGTLEKSAILGATMANYFAEKLGVAVANVAWRSQSNSEGTFAKVTHEDIPLAIQYVVDHAEALGIDITRMGLYGGSAGTPTSSLAAQLDNRISAYIGFNGSYDFVEGGYGAGGTSFEQHIPSYEANSAIYNIRDNPPATLMLHGSNDGIIPPYESLKYETALQAVGGDAETLLYEGFGHAFYNLGNPMHFPTMYASSKFLSRVFNLGVYTGVVAPPRPGGLTAIPGDGQVSLEWAADLITDPVTYSVYRSTTAGSYGSALVTGLTVNSHVDLHATNGILYFYRVIAVDGEGNKSAPSDEVFAIPASAANQAPAFTSDPINGGSIGTGVAYSGSIAEAASDPESDPMLFSKVSGPEWLTVASDGSLSGTAPHETGVNSFTVRVDAAGGSDTAILEITVEFVPDTTPPDPPTGLHASIQNGAVSLRWNDNTEADLASYSIYRRTVAGSTANPIATNLMSSAYLDETVTTETTYYYVATAVDTSGNESVFSAEVPITVTDAEIVALYSFTGQTLASTHESPATTASLIMHGGGLGAFPRYETRTTYGDTVPALAWKAFDFNDGTVLDDDYIAFTISPGDGVSLHFGSLSFLHRFGGNNGSDVHVFSSQGGFTAGNAIEIIQLRVRDQPTRFTVDLSALAPTSEPIEFRLYFHTTATFDVDTSIDEITVMAISQMGPVTDSDGDGIADDWEVANFGGLIGVDDIIHSESGVPYYFLYLSGWNQGDDIGQAGRVQMVQQLGDMVPALRWELMDGFELGVHVDVWGSSNLLSWAAIPPEDFTHETFPAGDGRTRHELRLHVDYGNNVFLRLQKP